MRRGFYVRYLNLCRQAGVEPSPPERVRELVAKWNAETQRARNCYRIRCKKLRLGDGQRPLHPQHRLFVGSALLTLPTHSRHSRLSKAAIRRNCRLVVLGL